MLCVYVCVCVCVCVSALNKIIMVVIINIVLLHKFYLCQVLPGATTDNSHPILILRLSVWFSSKFYYALGSTAYIITIVHLSPHNISCSYRNYICLLLASSFFLFFCYSTRIRSMWIQLYILINVNIDEVCWTQQQIIYFQIIIYFLEHMVQSYIFLLSQ